jgi:hypothetical protein
MRRVPLRDSVEVHQAILQIQLIETEFLDKELTSEQSSGYLEKVRKIRDIRWIPARYMERSSRADWYDKPLAYLCLVTVASLVVYGLSGLLKWLRRRTRTLFRSRSADNSASATSFQSTEDDVHGKQ